MTPPPPKRPRRRWPRLAAAAALLVALWLAASYAVAYRLTRRARPPFEEPAPAGFLALRLATADGEDLGAWFVEGRPGRDVVVLLHGNGGCRTACLPEAELASSLGCGVLPVTLRAHGDSTGAANDFGLSAAEDVLAAVAWVEQHHPGRRITVWGQSLGSAAALFAAGRLGDRVRSYILECPYRDLRTAVRNRVEERLPPGLSHVAELGLRIVAPLVLPDVDRISPLNAAEGMPSMSHVLILAGGADRRARPEEARAIAERLSCRPKLVIIEGGGHLGLMAADPDAYRAAVREFLTP